MDKFIFLVIIHRLQAVEHELRKLYDVDTVGVLLPVSAQLLDPSHVQLRHDLHRSEAEAHDLCFNLAVPIRVEAGTGRGCRFIGVI